LDEDAIVFCNFNKIDKIDPLSFRIWMNVSCFPAGCRSVFYVTSHNQVMHRIPNSYLWLLEPQPRFHPIPSTGLGNQNGSEAPRYANYSNSCDTVKTNLLSEAAANGIDSDRILFASRTKKFSHILRHFAADLFLDTFIYSAHSTATDAMRGVSLDLFSPI
jgi:predicted O-linked N-acetylglucosamine transferase (SPINDLY family)